MFSGMLLSACKVTSLEPKAFDASLKKDNGMLVDVRTPGEYSEEHIRGATMINYQDDTFKDQINKLDKNKPVYLYCRSGKRSAAAQEVMVKEGFKKVIHLKGGITAWKNEGLPTEK